MLRQSLSCQSFLLVEIPAITIIKAINFIYIKRIDYLLGYIKRILFITLFSNN